MCPVEHSLELERKWRVVQLGVVTRLALGVAEYQVFCMHLMCAESLLLLIVLSWNNRCSKKGTQPHSLEAYNFPVRGWEEVGTQGRLKKCRSIVHDITYGRNVLWLWHTVSEKWVLARVNGSSARANSYLQGNIIQTYLRGQFLLEGQSRHVQKSLHFINV